eukprot:COSAG06_NODE_47117_length_341_cov_1.264463_1_plen_53_part_01
MVGVYPRYDSTRNAATSPYGQLVTVQQSLAGGLAFCQREPRKVTPTRQAFLVP